jgi:hypothetical protein
MADWLEKATSLATATSLPSLAWRIIVLSALAAWFTAVGWKTIRSYLHPEERISAFDLKLCRLEDFIQTDWQILQAAGLMGGLKTARRRSVIPYFSCRLLAKASLKLGFQAQTRISHLQDQPHPPQRPRLVPSSLARSPHIVGHRKTSGGSGEVPCHGGSS